MDFNNSQKEGFFSNDSLASRAIACTHRVEEVLYFDRTSFEMCPYFELKSQSQFVALHLGHGVPVIAFGTQSHAAQTFPIDVIIHYQLQRKLA